MQPAFDVGRVARHHVVVARRVGLGTCAQQVAGGAVGDRRQIAGVDPGLDHAARRCGSAPIATIGVDQCGVVGRARPVDVAGRDDVRQRVRVRRRSPHPGSGPSGSRMMSASMPSWKCTASHGQSLAPTSVVEPDRAVERIGALVEAPPPVQVGRFPDAPCRVGAADAMEQRRERRQRIGSGELGAAHAPERMPRRAIQYK